MIITAVVNDKVRMNNYRAKFQVQSIYCSEDIVGGLGDQDHALNVKKTWTG